MFSIQLLVIHVLHSSNSFVSVNQQNVDVVGLTGSKMFIPTRNTSPLTSTLLQSPRKVVLVIIILFCLILLLSILKGMSNKFQEIMYSTFCLVYSILKSLQVVNVRTLVFRLFGMNNKTFLWYEANFVVGIQTFQITIWQCWRCFIFAEQSNSRRQIIDLFIQATYINTDGNRVLWWM